VNSEPVPSPLVCGKGHTARFRVALAIDGGWQVRVELDDRVVAFRHCADWHRVERFRLAVTAQLPDVDWIEPAGRSAISSLQAA
jgi:hypothetical protein